jgi:hypothetical protein
LNILPPGLELAKLAGEKENEYQQAEPFPNIAFPNFFDPQILDRVLDEFPDLSRQREVSTYDNPNERKLASRGEALFGPATRRLVHFLNSQPVLEFLQRLTGIKETLLPDPYLEGGGYHEIKPGGLLKVHADFNKSRATGLDRRINLLVYLNKNWEESYGGHLELWDRDMKRPLKKILPTFNTVAIFSTTDFSHHGHPNPLTCPPDRSRKSLALYYFSNGRPAQEVHARLEEHGTLFKARHGVANDVREEVEARRSAKSILKEFIPPVLLRPLKWMKWRFRSIGPR